MTFTWFKVVRSVWVAIKSDMTHEERPHGAKKVSRYCAFKRKIHFPKPGWSRQHLPLVYGNFEAGLLRCETGPCPYRIALIHNQSPYRRGKMLNAKICKTRKDST